MSDEDNLIRWELPLHKIIPKRLYEAQQSECASWTDAKLFAEAMPDSLDWRLRIRYNSLLQQFMDPMKPMSDRAIKQDDIFKDICTYDVFKRRTDNVPKAVFITRRIGSYLEDQDALLTAFSTRLWEVASAPITDDKGRIDIDAAKILHKTIQILLDRKFGMAVQRQVNVGINASQMDPIAIEAQIKQLEDMHGSSK
ncbi:MAG TPA: hypothetical protein VE954_43395 [Oligoflexus sp.]|uniref:hypothetical protein n=1 Tax=Oligoflexus sp. TaxID=1971216 RepID=UPI002D5B228C|nr:hypothetical protein [Oligoflexus sp.]HYX39991.1 hypothetical protein [Oligoflexus sp.]